MNKSFHSVLINQNYYWQLIILNKRKLSSLRYNDRFMRYVMKDERDSSRTVDLFQSDVWYPLPVSRVIPFTQVRITIGAFWRFFYLDTVHASGALHKLKFHISFKHY